MASANKSTLRQRFLKAVRSGQLGTRGGRGIVVTLKEFKIFFPDITSDYISSFLPAATLEVGRLQMTHTKYVIRKALGVYLVHSDVFKS